MSMELYWTDSVHEIRYRGRYTDMQDLNDACRDIFTTYTKHEPVVFYIDGEMSYPIQIHRDEV